MSTPVTPVAAPPSSTADQLRHVRWLVGGTGSGKSTVAEVLARRFDLDLYSGDRAEHDWLTRCTPERHPHLTALRDRGRPGETWRDRTGEQAFAAMPSRHGETVGFLVEDLVPRAGNRVVLVDYFGVLPRDLAPLLARPGHAAFLVPTPEFRRTVLTRRYSDPDRARANWGSLDTTAVLAARLDRDARWDAEVTRQASELGLPMVTADGTRAPEDLAAGLATAFGLVRG